jgi:transposase
LRGKVLEAYQAGQGSLQELAKRFRVSWGYSKKIRAQQLQTGRKERPQQRRHGPASRLTAAVEQQLQSALRQQPDLTLAEVQQRLAERAGISISRSRLWVWLQRMGLRHKKNAPDARTGQRGEPLAPAELVGTGSERDPACLVFLDESGVTSEMTRRYGWAPRPECGYPVVGFW